MATAKTTTAASKVVTEKRASSGRRKTDTQISNKIDGMKLSRRKTDAALPDVTAARKNAAPKRKSAVTVLAEQTVEQKAKRKPKKGDGIVKFRGFKIPTNRKNNDGDESVPTMQLKKVSDLQKLFDKLPKGCSVNSFEREIDIYNRSGALIAEVRTNK